MTYFRGRSHLEDKGRRCFHPPLRSVRQQQLLHVYEHGALRHCYCNVYYKHEARRAEYLFVHDFFPLISLIPEVRGRGRERSVCARNSNAEQVMRNELYFCV